MLEEWLASPGCAAVMVVWAPVEGVRSAWHTAVLELPPSFDPTLPMLPVLQATLPNEPRLSLLAKVTVPAGKAVILGAHVRLAVSGLSAIDLRWVALERRGRQHQATLSLKAALVARG